MVFTARVLTGETKRFNGEIVPLKGPDVKSGGRTLIDVGQNFLRSKLAPAPGAAIDWWTGENVIGEKMTGKDVLKRSVTPLAYNDVFKAMEEHGVARGAALSLLAIFGMGLQTYENKPKEPEEKPKTKKTPRRTSAPSY